MTRREIYERVAACKLATSMANAFRACFGIPPVLMVPRHGTVVSVDAYADLEWCMANHGSPLDGRI